MSGPIRRTAAMVTLGVLVLAAPALGSPVQATPAPVARCTEDSTCWACDTMGDGICGPGSWVAQ